MEEESEANDTVMQWLTNLGLGYAAENFQMAGILSPRSLSHLEVGHFKALGIKRPEDRKKLFFLVQRVTSELEIMDEAGEEDVGGHDEASEREARRDLNERDSSNLLADGCSSARGDNDDDYSEDFVSEATPGKLSSLNSKLGNGQRGSFDSGNHSRGKARLMGVAYRRNTPYPPTGVSNASSRRVEKDHGVVTAVETNSNMEPISPVTLGSPLSVDDVISHAKPESKRFFKERSKGNTTSNPNQKEIVRPNTRAFKRQQEDEVAHTVTRSKTSKSCPPENESTTARGYEDEFDELDEYLRSDGASIGSQSRHSSLSFDAAKKNTEQLDMDELEEYLTSDGENMFSTNSQREIVTPKATTTGRASFASRPTIKKTNQSNILKFSSSATPAVSSPYNDDDDHSHRSETSDLSTSLNSFSSLGSSSASNRDGFRIRKNSRASTGTHSSYRSGISVGHVDENKHRNVENKITPSSAKVSRLDIKSSIPTRTGKKRLSAIPSTKIAPVSPLVGLSSTQLDESIKAQSGTTSVIKPSSTSRRKSHLKRGASMSEASDSSGTKSGVLTAREKGVGLNSSFESTSTNASVSSNGLRLAGTSSSSRPSSRNSSRTLNNSNSNMNAYGIAGSSSVLRHRKLKSPTRNDRARAKSPGRGTSPRGLSMPRVQSPSPVKGFQGRSLSPIRSVTRRASPRRDRSLSPMERSRTRSVSPKSPGRMDRGRGKSPVNSGAVFVHGMPEDNSWATQIERLKEKIVEEHDEFMMGREAYREDEEYEMRIRVIVRKRPMSKREAAGTGDVDVIHPLDYDDHGRIIVYQPKTKVDLTREVETSPFSFDNVFNENSNNLEIYERSVQNLIPGVFRGKWASVFAYGQTGSGKTFTMMGSNMTGMRAGNQAENISDANLGLYFLAAQDVFRIAEEPEFENISIGVSLFEIYGGKLLDLLNNRNAVKCLEDNKGKVCFPGLSEHPAHNPNELMEIIEHGGKNRSTGTTSANADSSRSHAVLRLSLRKNIGKVKNKEHGRLTFIDLAGSERGADTAQANRTVRMEGAEINTSLLALKEVIRALATGSSMKRIPFRGSKLTQVLKESFVGKKSRTVMVACVAPNMNNVDHTLNTLRYADRVKERDPHTGKLTAAVAASSNIKRDQDDLLRVKLPCRPLTAPASSFRIDDREDDSSGDDIIPPPPSNKNDFLFQSLVDKENFTDDDEADEAYSDRNEATEKSEIMDKYEDLDDNDSLDIALRSTNNSPATNTSAQRLAHSQTGDSLAQSLIATHRNIVSTMLSTVKLEMALANETDKHRDNMEDYLRELETISDKQLSLISTLKASLAAYNASKKNERATFSSPLSYGTNTDVDESFDLRF